MGRGRVKRREKWWRSFCRGKEAQHFGKHLSLQAAAILMNETHQKGRFDTIPQRECHQFYGSLVQSLRRLLGFPRARYLSG